MGIDSAAPPFSEICRLIGASAIIILHYSLGPSKYNECWSAQLATHHSLGIYLPVPVEIPSTNDLLRSAIDSA